MTFLTPRANSRPTVRQRAPAAGTPNDADHVLLRRRLRPRARGSGDISAADVVALYAGLKREPWLRRGMRFLRAGAASVVFSAVGVGLLVWWVVRDLRSLWMLVAGFAAAVAGVAVAARARRDTSGERPR